jgi:RNA polymerase sigma-70 factor, ECF subfamily
VDSHHKNKEDLEREAGEVQKAQKNPAAFAPLYERYYEVLFRFFWNRTEDYDLSSDLTQHTFLKALRNLGSYQFRNLPFSAWLFRIGINEMNMYFRKAERERIVPLDLTLLCEWAGEEGIDGYLEKEFTRVEKLILDLPPDQLALIELRFFEKKSFLEIGQIMKISENNAKVKTYRVLDKIRKLMEEKE